MEPSGEPVGAGRLTGLIDDELFGRLMRDRGLFVFAVDAERKFAYVDDATAALLGPPGTAAAGGPFRVEALLPVARVEEAVEVGLGGGTPDTCLVVMRGQDAQTSI